MVGHVHLVNLDGGAVLRPYEIEMRILVCRLALGQYWKRQATERCRENDPLHQFHGCPLHPLLEAESDAEAVGGIAHVGIIVAAA